MPKDDRVRILHMVDAAREAAAFVEGRGRKDLNRDRLLVLGLMKSIEIIGEAAAHITQPTRSRLPSIP